MHKSRAASYFRVSCSAASWPSGLAPPLRAFHNSLRCQFSEDCELSSRVVFVGVRYCNPGYGRDYPTSAVLPSDRFPLLSPDPLDPAWSLHSDPPRHILPCQCFLIHRDQRFRAGFAPGSRRPHQAPVPVIEYCIAKISVCHSKIATTLSPLGRSAAGAFSCIPVGYDQKP
ncbi:hypothetical protein QR680_017452 [Steinernema hermaphroditum]|uniref:Uncharacterized protein n=1 Tax=Steinernema hermaphroditum TaxID=289476 RepID=A0AA39LPB6_9BILA|nr:hypothetical protein QR680_017452 [Steinernema hermaphroditum]